MGYGYCPFGGYGSAYFLFKIVFAAIIFSVIFWGVHYLFKNAKMKKSKKK